MLKGLLHYTDNDDVIEPDNRIEIWPIQFKTMVAIDRVLTYCIKHDHKIFACACHAPLSHEFWKNALSSQRGWQYACSQIPGLAEADAIWLADVESKMHKPRKNVRYADIATKATDASVQKPIALLEFIIQDIMGLELDDKKRICRMGYYAKQICRAKNIGTENNSVNHACHYDRLLNGGGSRWEAVRLTVEEKLSIV